MSLPTTQWAVHQWTGAIWLLYLGIALALKSYYKWSGTDLRAGTIEMVFNGGLFASACMVAIGVIEEQVFHLIHDTMFQLILSAIVSAGYAVWSLGARSRDRSHL